MKKTLFLSFFMMLIFSISMAKKETKSKVVQHSSAVELSEGEYAVIKVPANITLLEINTTKFKVNEARIFIAPGSYTFKARLLGGFADFPKVFTSDLEAGKFYKIQSSMERGFLAGKTAYKIVETTQEDAEYPF